MLNRRVDLRTARHWNTLNARISVMLKAYRIHGNGNGLWHTEIAHMASKHTCQKTDLRINREMATTAVRT